MNYEIAPIREAIFDIRIPTMNIDMISVLEKIHEKVKDNYPEKRKQFSLTETIHFKGKDPSISRKAKPEIRGFIFSNKNHNCQVQVRLDGFTFNMLKPYSNWEEFSEEAFKLWTKYINAIGKREISRITLRYINKINIPLPFDNFQEYITNVPPIPKCLPQTFKTFFMQIEVPCLTENANVILTETIEKPSKDNLPFILDIDVYKSQNINSEEKELKKSFLDLRNLKNNTFEDCITEKTRNLFN